MRIGSCRLWLIVLMLGSLCNGGCQSMKSIGQSVNPKSVKTSASVEQIESLKKLPPAQRRAALKGVRNEASNKVERQLAQAVNWRSVAVDKGGFVGERRVEDEENKEYWARQRYGWKQFETLQYEPPGAVGGILGTASRFHVVYEPGANPKMFETEDEVGFRAKFRDEKTAKALMDALQLAVVAQRAGEEAEKESDNQRNGEGEKG